MFGGEVMSKEQQDLLYYMNKVNQLEQLLEVERVKNYSLRKLLVELRFASLPFLNKIQNISKVKE